MVQPSTAEQSAHDAMPDIVGRQPYPGHRLGVVEVDPKGELPGTIEADEADRVPVFCA